MVSSTLVILGLSAFVAAVSCDESTPVPIVSQEQKVNEDGGYKWSYESGDGSKASQEGEIRTIDKNTTVEVAQGSYSYNDPDGKSYSVQYVADEKGYQPTGEHLPVAPEVPPLIARALQYLATAKPTTDKDN